MSKKVGYIRVSTIKQNLDRQLDGLELDKIFKDKCSGKDTNRPGLTSMLEYIREEDIVYVHSMCRLARSLKDLLSLVENLTSKKIKIVFIKENLTFAGDDSPISKLLLCVMGSVAQFERELSLERQREGIEIAKRKGKYKRIPPLTQEQLEEIKIRIGNHEPIARIARDFGVSRGTIYNYMKGGNN